MIYNALPDQHHIIMLVKVIEMSTLAKKRLTFSSMVGFYKPKEGFGFKIVEG